MGLESSFKNCYKVYSFRQLCVEALNHWIFQAFISFLIILNAFFMASEYANMSESHKKVLEKANVVSTKY